MNNVERCGCLHPDPVECAKLQDHNVFLYCPCEHHQRDVWMWSTAITNRWDWERRIANAEGQEDSEC